VALYGRKINNAEHQLAFIAMLRLITDGKISPEEAVRAYHGVLQNLGIAPKRTLENDLELTDQSMSYGGSSRTVSIPPAGAKPAAETVKVANPVSAPVPAANPVGPVSELWPKTACGKPDFAKMTSAQRLSYDRARLTKKYG
jgi:hypothetical protein